METGRREEGKKCRCEALRSIAKQSEAIPIGIASTILPAYGLKIINHETHEESYDNNIKIKRFVLLLFVVNNIVILLCIFNRSQVKGNCFGLLTQCLATTLLPLLPSFRLPLFPSPILRLSRSPARYPNDPDV